MIITPILFSQLAFSSGLLQDLNSIVEIQKSNYQKKLTFLQKKSFNIKEVKDIALVKIDPDFISNILFNSPKRYTSLGLQDSCSLYDLFTTNLLKDANGDIRHIIFNYPDKKGVTHTRVLKKESFLRLIAYKKCPGVAKLKNYFQTRNLRKTLKSIALPTPKNQTQCHDIHKKFLKDYKTPHLCEIYEDIRSLPKEKRRIKKVSKNNLAIYTSAKRRIERGNSLLKIIKPQAQNYLSRLCLNLDSPKIFCAHFFQKNYWSQADLTKNESALRTFCNIKKKKMSKFDISRCAKKLEQKPETCYFPKDGNSSLLPKNDCRIISQALSYSRLQTDYKDCPAVVGNTAIVTMSRIINHTTKETKSSKLISKSSDCAVRSTLPFAKLNTEENDGNAWNIQICYEDKIKAKEICLPTILGETRQSTLSLPVVVGKMMARLKGFDNKNSSCEMVSKKVYKPALLKFQTGCFIIVDKEMCTGVDCPLKIVLSQNEFKGFKLKSSLKFDFFPTDYVNENKSQINLYARLRKKELKPIKNISSLKRTFTGHKQAILVGISCLEELLPSFFKIKTFNMCTPMPFIIDGYLEENGIYSMVVRTSIDDLHAPRIVPWTYVFSSLKSYQKYHPINLWGLYALY